MRRDPRGRVYYVDHNTRTTTWQRPTENMLQAHRQWENGRADALQQYQNRFLYNQPGSQTALTEDDPLGPMPEGWVSFDK